MNRRELFTTAGAAAAGVVAGAGWQATPKAAEQQKSVADAASVGATGQQKGEAAVQNPYGSPPGSGISMPPYYRPTPSVKNRNNFFPQTEEIGKDEMRVTFMGSNPWPPRLDQAGTCIMVETGNGGRFFFDFGSGCLRNIIGMQVPIPEINDIFITHLHVDHFADLPYLYAFAPFSLRWKPLRVIGPSGRKPEFGTAAMTKAMREMCRWHIQSFSSAPVGNGYEVEVTEFDFHDDGGVCYDKNGVTVRHWRRSHTMDGASAYRLDWNGLSFVWTGDGKPDQLTAKFAKSADVFVTEMAVDNPALWALKQGIPDAIGAYTIDSAHTPHYGVGYLCKLINPRLGMTTHVSFDRELLGAMMAGVRLHWKGLFGFGIDRTVVNVTKDAIWIREATIPESTNTARPNPQWMVKEMFGGQVPKEITFPKPEFRVTDNQEQSVRDLEIPPEVYTPPDQLRKWVREWPADLKIDASKLIGR